MDRANEVTRTPQPTLDSLREDTANAKEQLQSICDHIDTNRALYPSNRSDTKKTAQLLYNLKNTYGNISHQLIARLKKAGCVAESETHERLRGHMIASYLTAKDTVQEAYRDANHDETAESLLSFTTINAKRGASPRPPALETGATETLDNHDSQNERKSYRGSDAADRSATDHNLSDSNHHRGVNPQASEFIPKSSEGPALNNGTNQRLTGGTSTGVCGIPRPDQLSGSALPLSRFGQLKIQVNGESRSPSPTSGTRVDPSGPNRNIHFVSPDKDAPWKSETYRYVHDPRNHYLSNEYQEREWPRHRVRDQFSSSDDEISDGGSSVYETVSEASSVRRRRPSHVRSRPVDVDPRPRHRAESIAVRVDSHRPPPDTNTDLSKHVLKQNIYRKENMSCFDGRPAEYEAWKSKLFARIRPLGVSLVEPYEEIGIIEANTGGEPQRTVKQLAIAYTKSKPKGLKVIWATLDRRYGCDSKVAASIRDQLKALPNLQFATTVQYERFADTLAAASQSVENIPQLGEFNFPPGLKQLREKLPLKEQEEWQAYGRQYEKDHGGRHPSFKKFARFVQGVAERAGDENYAISRQRAAPPGQSQSGYRSQVNTHATLSTEDSWGQSSVRRKPAPRCAYPGHDSADHWTQDCADVKGSSVDARYELAKEQYLCFRCFGGHRGGLRNCTTRLRCGKCNSLRHHTLLHRPDRTQHNTTFEDAAREKTSHLTETQMPEGEPNAERDGPTPETEIAPGATSLSTTTRHPKRKPCGKAFLTIVTAPAFSTKSVLTYTLIDDCSDQTFCDERILHELDVPAYPVIYDLTTVDRSQITKSGFQAEGLIVRGAFCMEKIELPTTFTTDGLPDVAPYLASPETIRGMPHLAEFARFFPEIRGDASLTILAGRDAEDLMWIQTLGSHKPYIHLTKLGHALMGRPIPDPIPPDDGATTESNSTFTTKTRILPPRLPDVPQITNVFDTTKNDEMTALSIQDQKFIRFLRQNVTVGTDNHLVFPLPFKDDPANLPVNKSAVVRRMVCTLRSLEKRPTDLAEALVSMGKSIEEKHVELVHDASVFQPDPPSGAKFKPYYNPVFATRHPKSLKLRNVFDAAAKYHGKSLNDWLQTGPDINNRLVAILTRFREDVVAISGDIRNMFHMFRIPDEQKDLLRFIWYRNNDPSQGLAVYRARVHVFGNCSSPGVSIFGLRLACEDDEEIHEFVSSSFYVDDLLAATSSAEKAQDLMLRTQSILARRGLTLHKVMSNSETVLQQFEKSAVVPELVDMDIENAPPVRSLGLSWNINKDCFVIKTNVPNHPFTRRGVLSTVATIYDPCGFVTPTVLQGKILLRKMMLATNGSTWDSPLPEAFRAGWTTWLSTLPGVERLTIRRCLSEFPSPDVVHRSLHTFVDASQEAIGYCVYLRTVHRNGSVDVYLVSGNSKLTPRAATTIPRLELCACLEGARAANAINSDFKHKVQAKMFYTDSLVAKGFLSNEARRFTVYVANRVASCLNLTRPQEWSYVPTAENPADYATRPTNAEALERSSWFKGPTFLRTTVPEVFAYPPEGIPDGDKLPELIKADLTCTTTTTTKKSKSNFEPNKDVASLDVLFLRSNSWWKLVNITRCVLIALKKFRKQNPAVTRREAELALIRDAQRSTNIGTKTPSLQPLVPFADENNTIRVGGRLTNAAIDFELRHPVIIPNEHPIAKAIVLAYHRRTSHQGRSITTGEVHASGYFVLKASSVVKEVIRKCTTCVRFRGVPSAQQMAPLPRDRVTPCPVFTYVGTDAFGPYSINDGPITRRTVQRKVFVIIFVCQFSRAVHLEVVHSMSTSSFLMSLRRFQATRGNCIREMRSDRGGNFIGSVTEPDAGLNITEASREAERLGIAWRFNPPLAPSWGGSWERKIGCVKKVFNSSLSMLGNRLLSLEEFETLIAEAAGVVNRTPLTATVEEITGAVVPISPAMLLHGAGTDCLNPPPLDSFTQADIVKYGRQKWRRVQAISNYVYERWSTEYRHTLLERTKWFRPSRAFLEGDVVLSTEKVTKRNEWKVGRVEETVTGSDGLVRQVKVRFGGGKILERPTSTLLLLVPTNSD